MADKSQKLYLGFDFSTQQVKIIPRLQTIYNFEVCSIRFELKVCLERDNSGEHLFFKKLVFQVLAL